MNMDFLKAIEQSGICSWIRESSSIWAYPTFIFMHSLGMGFLVGASMVIDLRLLGYGRGLPLEPMKKFFPVIWFGFGVNAASGFVLTMIDVNKWLHDPLFYIKLSCIALAMITGRLIWIQVFRNASSEDVPVGMGAKVLAMASLVLWLASITAGRLTAYLFTHSGLTASIR
jgi:hypothetical protein